MDRRIPRLVGGMAAALLALPLLAPTALADHTAGAPPAPPTPDVEQPDPVTVSREGGETRVETSVEISRREFDPASTDVVVIARADEYADALTGGPLAAVLGAPILLTWSDHLDADVLTEIQRLGPSEVVLLGGTSAIADAVEADLEAAGFDTRRVAGTDRFETGAKIASEVAAGDTGGTVFLVEGAHSDPTRGWPDGVSISPYASFLQRPVLPVARGFVPDFVSDMLTAVDPDEIVLIGGTAAISQEVEDALTPAEGEEGPTVRRLSGSDRFATSAAIYDEAITRGLAPDVKWLATGLRFPDALTGGAAAGQAGEALLLVPGSNITASEDSMERLTATFDRMREVVLLGRHMAISEVSESAVEAAVAPAVLPAADLCLTVLHNNDGESQMLNAGSGLEDFGGAHRFAERLLTERARGQLPSQGCGDVGVLTVTSGDNFLAGPEFSASRDHGVPFYDSLLYDYLNYDAIDLGNHDFDLGPDVTAQVIEGFSDDDDAVFVSANLDWSAHAGLQAQDDRGKLASSTTVDLAGHTIGVIGLTTPAIECISSPGPDVDVQGGGADCPSEDLDVLAGIVNDEATALMNDESADIIVLISHLQSVENDKELAPLLDDVDIVVAGGGDEVLAAPGEMLVPGDETIVAEPYPTFVEGSEAPIVTTAGSYKYVGRLVSRFDAAGDLVAVDTRNSRMVRVAGGDLPDAVDGDEWVTNNIVAPIADYVADLATTEIGTSSVPLDGTRQSVRTQEANLGNLLADAMAWTAEQEAASYDLDPTANFVGLQNGGGIRNDTVIPAGPITELHTFDVAPFPNFVTVFEDVTVDQLDQLLEHAYSATDEVAGQFAQIGNLLVDVDRDAPVGSRVSNHRLAETGAALTDGFSLATIDFLAGGGDGYPFEDAGLTSSMNVGASYQEALSRYIQDGLGGSIDAAGYPAPGGYPAINTPPDNAQRIVFTDL